MVFRRCTTEKVAIHDGFAQVFGNRARDFLVHLMGFGFWELMIILAIVVLVFGASRLPQLGDAVGKTIRNFKKSTKEDDAIDVTPKKALDDDTKKS